MIKMSKNCSISADAVFKSIKNPNDIITLQIKSEETTDIDAMISWFIKTQETHSESLKDITLNQKVFSQ